MAEIFYKIDYKDRTYIGELADLDFFGFHLKKALPWNDSPSTTDMEHEGASRWENQLYEDIRQYGLKDTLSGIKTASIGFSSGVSFLVNSMQSFVKKHQNESGFLYNSGQEMYDDMVASFGVSDIGLAEVRVPEMLLILLQSKKTDMWNMHANYGPRSGDRITDADITKIISEETIQKREQALGRASIWYTFKIDKLPQDIELVAKKTYANGNIKFDVNNPINRVALKKINHVVKNTTLDSLHRQINAICERLKKDVSPQKRNLVPVLEDMMATIDQTYGYSKNGKTSSVSTHKQLRTLISDLDKTLDEEMTQQMFFTPEPLLKKKIQTWLAWILETNDMPTFSSTDELAVINWYKGELIKAIQLRCFSDGINYEYQDWKLFYGTSREDFEQSDDNFDKEQDKSRWVTTQDELYMSPGRFYPVWCRRRGWEEPEETLCSKTYAKITELGSYIMSNWTCGMYNEQVAYFLSQNDVAFSFTQITKGFINTITIDEMKYY